MEEEISNDPVEPVYTGPEYVDVYTVDGTLRVVYEMTVGDVIVSSLLVLILVFLILRSVLKITWR